MSEITQDGFRWDTGPSVITMRPVIEGLFQAAGRRMEDYLTLQPIDPLTRYFYPDGTQIDIARDLTHTLEQIAALNAHDVEGYQQYLAYAAQIHRVTGPVFIYDKPPTPSSFLRVPIRDWLKADPFRTMQQAIRSYVQSPYLRQLLGRFATYVGGSPYQAPATLNVIADVELSGGVWYPQGGVYRIAEALEQVAQECGVDILTSTEVTRLHIERGQAVGIWLANGVHIPANVVISNADVTSTLSRLAGQEPRLQSRIQRLKRYDPSCSGYILMLGIEGTHPELAHHNIFFSGNYPAEFKSIFKTLMPPVDPTLYVAITSKTDPAHAPEGCENWFILVNAPPLSERYDWRVQADVYRALIMQRLAERGYDIESRIRSEVMMSPVDLEQQSWAWRGALYGPSANNRFTVFRRPHNRSPEIRGLYFAGGTTHPGGGVPMVMLSGKVAAEMVLADFA
jgi:phytoene desaturase